MLRFLASLTITAKQCKTQPIEMAGMPNSKLKIPMNVSIASKWLVSVKRPIQQMPGRIESPLTLQIGNNHGTTKSTVEIQNHHRRSVLNRVSAITQGESEAG